VFFGPAIAILKLTLGKAEYQTLVWLDYCKLQDVTRFVVNEASELTAVFRLLLAEDNAGDVLLFREALKSCDFSFELVVVQDGQAAIDVVENHPATGTRVGLDLVVLDVNLPKRNGDEVLQRIRREPALSGLPVIMLTSSSLPADQKRAGELGATLFLQKPSTLDQLLDIAKVIEEMLKGCSSG
jgi:CheY-like chemotaxis protein